MDQHLTLNVAAFMRRDPQTLTQAELLAIKSVIEKLNTMTDFFKALKNNEAAHTALKHRETLMSFVLILMFVWFSIWHPFNKQPLMHKVCKLECKLTSFY